MELKMTKTLLKDGNLIITGRNMENHEEIEITYIVDKNQLTGFFLMGMAEINPDYLKVPVLLELQNLKKQKNGTNRPK